MKNETIVPATIKALRQDLRLTQEQFSNVFGVSPQTVSKWERGKLKFPWKQHRLFRFCRAALADYHFKAVVHYLAGLKESPNAGPSCYMERTERKGP